MSDKELYTDRFYAVLAAKSLGFDKFVSDDNPRINVYVCNAHFRQLANSCWSLEKVRGLKDVCRFIDGMPWYYVCEYPDLSLRWMRRVFDWGSEQIPRENVTGDQRGQATTLSTLDDHTYEIICRKNDLDFAIYKYRGGSVSVCTGVADGEWGVPAIVKRGVQKLSEFLAANDKQSI